MRLTPGLAEGARCPAGSTAVVRGRSVGAVIAWARLWPFLNGQVSPVCSVQYRKRPDRAEHSEKRSRFFGGMEGGCQVVREIRIESTAWSESAGPRPFAGPARV